MTKTYVYFVRQKGGKHIIMVIKRLCNGDHCRRTVVTWHETISDLYFCDDCRVRDEEAAVCQDIQVDYVRIGVPKEVWDKKRDRKDKITESEIQDLKIELGLMPTANKLKEGNV